MKAINAFEVTYNGHPLHSTNPNLNPSPNPSPNQVTYNGQLLHSKLATSAFPNQQELHQRLLAILQAEQSR